MKRAITNETGWADLGVQYPLTVARADVTSSGGGAGDEERLISMRTIGRSESNQRGRTVPPALLIHK